MSSMSSLADASSGAGEELSFTKYGKTMGHESAQWKSKDSEAGEELSFTKYGKTMGHESAQIRGPLSSTAQWKSNDSEVYSENYLRHQLFLKAAEAKKWQDSVLHLAGVATGKDEELNLERSRNIQMAAALERAEDAAELRQLELESTREENQAALQQVAALQSEMQSILSTCSLLESRSIQLGILQSPMPLLPCLQTQLSATNFSISPPCTSPCTHTNFQKVSYNKSAMLGSSQARTSNGYAWRQQQPSTKPIGVGNGADRRCWNCR